MAGSKTKTRLRWVRIRAILAIQIGAGCRLDEVLSLTPYDLQEFLTEIGLSGHHDKPTTLWEDNTSCIALSKNPGQHKRTRHILLKYFYIRHKVADGTVRLEYVVTTDERSAKLTPKGARIDQTALRQTEDSD